MNAAEMFKQVGFEKISESRVNVVYERETEFSSCCISFLKWDESINISRGMYIHSELLKAIIQQVKELGWLDESVENSVPKKPKPFFTNIVPMPYRCPVCGTFVSRRKERFNYCPECGQAIDWR